MPTDESSAHRRATPTAARLLVAAAEALGGNKALSERLGVSQTLLIKYMAGHDPVPEALTLAAVDILLAERETKSGSGEIG